MYLNIAAVFWVECLQEGSSCFFLGAPTEAPAWLTFIVSQDSWIHRLFREEGFNFGVFLIFSGLIFSIGAFGVAFNRKNVLLLMASIEIMFLGINLVFISGSIFLNLEVGLIYGLIGMSLSAAEAAIGFGLLAASFRNRPDISFSNFNKLKG
jgi:NADH:ubiquinone oxidoreductase subunit K